MSQQSEKTRLQREGLKTMCIHIPIRLYRAFGVKVARDRVTRRAVATAMIELYVQGGFTVEKQKDHAEKK